MASSFFAPPTQTPGPVAPGRPKPMLNQTAQQRTLAQRQRAAMSRPSPVTASPGSPASTGVVLGSGPQPTPVGQTSAPQGPAPVDYTSRMVGVPIPGVNAPMPGATPGAVPGVPGPSVPGGVPGGVVGAPSATGADPTRPSLPGTPPILAPKPMPGVVPTPGINGQVPNLALAEQQKRAMQGSR